MRFIWESPATYKLMQQFYFQLIYDGKCRIQSPIDVGSNIKKYLSSCETF